MNRPEPFASAEGGDRLVIQCLGRFLIRQESGPEIPVRTRKARAVLAYAALNARSISREQITALLWSDRGEEQARASLRQTLFELRRLSDPRHPPLTVDRDHLQVNQLFATTDIKLINDSASADDADELVDLLARGNPGLLADLDGLDPEFDSWLRSVRAEEPAHMLAAVLAVASERLDRSDLPVARDLASQVLRLDPTNEDGIRLTMQIDRAGGDMSALHRHFNCFRQSMREQFDAPPSTETERLYRDLVNGAAPQSQSGASNVDCAEAAAPTANRRWLWSMIALVAAITALLGLWRWSESQMPPGDQMLIAVLPFEAQFADDRLIANGIAEQTRLALSRNASLRILGRATTAAMVAEERPPKQVSRRFGVTHILDGTVRRSGGDVIVSVSLAQTDDGVVIWQDSFRGALNRPFPLQDSIAQGIEGKLRGRLASNGGRRADQIGTTLEVYALYSEARGLLGNRDREGMRRAEALLREAVRRDPNYAPAWSLLGGALHFNQRIAIADSAIRAEAFAAVRRALTLAPNLAQAHATLALLEGDNSPASEPSLRRAIALDPNYAEAWNWLGNSLNSQNRRREALAAYARSLSIDPLYPAAARNFVRTASDLGDTVASNALIRKLTAGGATPALIDSLRADHLYGQRDYSGTIALLRKAGRDDDGRIPSYIWGNWLDTLTSLGLYDELHGITGCPEWYAPMLQARISPPKAIEGKPVAPDEFWTSTYFSTPASRTMIRLGRERELVGIYRAGFKDADDFISSIQRRGMLPTLAPSLAVALTATGARDEGQYILVAAARQLAPIAGRGANAAAQSQLALVRSVQGQRRQALALLGASVQGGWLPDGREVALDLADEPAFRPLRGDPRFEAIRRRILAHIARERAETGPIKV